MVDNIERVERNFIGVGNGGKVQKSEQSARNFAPFVIQNNKRVDQR
jgi:hypothetical protein